MFAEPLVPSPQWHLVGLESAYSKDLLGGVIEWFRIPGDF